VYNFYKRLTPLADFDLYSNFANTWDSNSSTNTLGVDFQLYSNYSDLFAENNNTWKYCDPAPTPGKGYPGNCGPTAGTAVRDKWVEFHDNSLPYFGEGQPTAEIWVELTGRMPVRQCVILLRALPLPSVLALSALRVHLARSRRWSG
jgi:hypothetical protein